MSVIVCGRKVRWQKPIKIYTFFKSVLWLAVVMTLSVTPSFASEQSFKNIKASTGKVQPCTSAALSQLSPSAGNAARDTRLPIQRKAGTPSAPAMALALALGYRNISGPMERTAPPRAEEE